jgi:hypothetical protein
MARSKVSWYVPGTDDIRWGYLTDERPAPLGQALLVGDDGRAYPAAALPSGTQLVLHDPALPPRLHRLCHQAGYRVGSPQERMHDALAQRVPAEAGEQTRLQDVLPEIRDVAQKVGGMRQLADIAQTLDQTEE